MSLQPRLPTRDDFLPRMNLDVIPPPRGSPVNILILLHGLGDTNRPFTSLGKNLNLPDTACLAIQGFQPIPALFTGSEDPAFHWGDDVVLENERGGINFDAGFTATHLILLQLIKGVLIAKCNFPARNILFLGFGQGGMAALHTAAASEMEFGGIVSIGGRFPSSMATNTTRTSASKNGTPVLVCGGNRSTEITRSSIDTLKKAFQDVEYVKWEKYEDSMPRNREEMLPIMRFFARRLRTRAGVPEGAVEI